MSSPGPDSLPRIRFLLLGLLGFGVGGMLFDLVLLKHFEGPWQIAPLVLLGASLLALGWLGLGSGAGRVHVFRVLMALVGLAGLAGILLHYQGGREFQTETYPELSGWHLFLKVVQSKSPPALAPAAMLQLGLLGLLATYRHPAIPERDPSP